MDHTVLTVAQQGMRVVGVPVRAQHFKRDFLQEMDNGEPAELVRVLVPMQDAQASFQISSPSAASGLSYLLCTVPPSITHGAAADYDALMECALASIIDGDGAATTGLSTPEEVAHHPTVCLSQTYLEIGASKGDPPVHLEGSLGLTSRNSIKRAA